MIFTYFLMFSMEKNDNFLNSPDLNKCGMHTYSTNKEHV